MIKVIYADIKRILLDKNDIRSENTTLEPKPY